MLFSPGALPLFPFLGEIWPEKTRKIAPFFPSRVLPHIEGNHHPLHGETKIFFLDIAKGLMIRWKIMGIVEHNFLSFLGLWRWSRWGFLESLISLRVDQVWVRKSQFTKIDDASIQIFRLKCNVLTSFCIMPLRKSRLRIFIRFQH